MRPAVYLNPKKQGGIQKGHPWIFPKAIASSRGRLVTSELVDVYSSDQTLLGVGVYNEHSLYCVRMLAYAFESIDSITIETIVSHRLEQAINLREKLGLPNLQTTAYRLFNSEGDGLSGLTIDRFNRTCVVASSAYWVEAHKDLIARLIRARLASEEVIWMPQIKPLGQDGWRPIPEQNEIQGSEQVLEEGVIFQVDFSNTQKTGLFLDQRENHQRVASLAKNKRVLDLYTYTGGFALHAAKGGAAHVTAVDSSEQAIALAARNAKLNQTNQIEFIEGDARDYLSRSDQYDLVVLDPPKLVPSKSHMQRAKNYYRFLHREVFKHMKAGSLLMTCNCSSALSAQEFSELVCSQAMSAGKIARIIGVYGPACCHPTLSAFPEGQYLTAILLTVS